MQTSGNYLIYGCGSLGDAIKGLLEHTHSRLEEAIEALDAGGPLGRPPAYTAFFHSASPDLVAGVLKRIVAGANITVEGREWRPTIVCSNPTDPALLDSWQRCQKTNAHAFHDGHQNVYICPSSIRMKAYPDSRDCARHPVAKGVMATGQGLVRTLFSILLHELVHLYLGRPGLRPEVYGIFGCLELGANEAVINSGSYAFYIASMFSTPSLGSFVCEVGVLDKGLTEVGWLRYCGGVHAVSAAGVAEVVGAGVA